MYPQGELNQLAFGKASLRERIRNQRTRISGALAAVTSPLEKIDRARQFWCGLPPWWRIALVATGVIAARKFLLSAKIMRRLLRWSPMFFQIASTLRRTGVR